MKKSARFIPIIFIGPAFLLFTIFLVWPTILSFYLSLTSWDGIVSEMKFVGLNNFIRLFHDAIFFKALKNTLVFTIITLIFQHLFALILAEFVDKKLRGTGFFKALFFIPSLFATIVVGTVFMYVFNPYFGIFNKIIEQLGMNQLAKINFLGNTKLVLGVIIFVNLWQWFGYTMMIYLGAIQGIDQSIIEASIIDGSNEWQKFWKVKFPMIAPAFTINTLLTVIGSLKTFDLVYIMTSGGPNHASDTVGTLIYSAAFKSQEFGYGTAMSLVLFVIIALIGFILEFTLTKREVTV